MLWWTAVIFLGGLFYSSFAYRDGVRENSCFNHTIDHGPDLILRNCVPPSCRYFLRVKEVFMENLTNMSIGDAENITCGEHLYSIEVANTLNPPEGFLVQARSGPEDSSEIIGTFLDTSNVTSRNPTVAVNYKILQCQRYQDADPLLYPAAKNSATHPRTVNTDGRILLYWKPPMCGEYSGDYVYFWFTIVQQLLLGYFPSKTSNILQYTDTTISTSTTSESTTTITSESTTTITYEGTTTGIPTTVKPLTNLGIALIVVAIGSFVAAMAAGAVTILYIVLRKRDNSFLKVHYSNHERSECEAALSKAKEVPELTL